MSVDESPAQAAPRKGAGRRPRTLPWWGFGAATMAVTLALSVSSWWLLVDPRWSPFDVYPQPFTALLFWVVMATIWVGFTFEWLGPARTQQPWRGLIGIAASIAIGVAITLLLAHGWGAVDPSFAADREGGAGYTTGNLIVLFAFYFVVSSAVNGGHWPWGDRATVQPWTGLGDFAVTLIPTLLLYGVLVLPNLATWATPGSALMSVPTLIGWFYSCVVAVVVTGLLAGNWPWRLAGSRGAVALAAVVGNIGLGTVLYFVLRAAAQLLMGSDNAQALGVAVNIHAAELGVCWVLWMMAWANVFGNRPTHLREGANVGIRVAVTFLLGCGTYLLYYFVVAGPVLHEPQVVGGMHGDALGFVDWVITWLLWYFLFLGSAGLPRPRDAA